MSINLDNLKTYHQYDQSETYEQIIKFPRHFEKGYYDAQSTTLEHVTADYTDFNILTTGKDLCLANFARSLAPFFLKVPLTINTTARLPLHAKNDSFFLLLSSDPNLIETKSITLELEAKKLPYCNLEYQSLAHTLGFLFGIVSRFDVVASKNIDFPKLSSLVEETVSKLTKDVSTKNNPAKILASKHSQKAILYFSAGHLTGVSSYASGLTTRFSKSFSDYWEFPEAKYISESIFTYPTKVLTDYQVILISSDLFPNNIKSELQDFKNLLAQKRINYTEIKPDSHDWFEQIVESVAFFTFFSYYVSINNKVTI